LIVQPFYEQILGRDDLFQKINNAVIGVSSIEHAKKTFEIFLEKNKL